MRKFLIALIFSVIIVSGSANYQETVFNYGMVITALCPLDRIPSFFSRYPKAPKSQQINGQFSCIFFVLIIKLLGESTMNLSVRVAYVVNNVYKRIPLTASLMRSPA